MPLSMRLVRNQGGQIRKLQDKVEKLKEKLKATERAQSTEENRPGGQLLAVRRQLRLQDRDDCNVPSRCVKIARGWYQNHLYT